MKLKNISYRHILLVKKLLIVMLFLLLGMQSVVTYLLAITLESKKEIIASILDETSGEISKLHQSHLSYIENKIDEVVTKLKKISTEHSKQEKSRGSSSALFFTLYCEPLPYFEFKIICIENRTYNVLDDLFISSLWVAEQPHPPKS